MSKQGNAVVQRREEEVPGLFDWFDTPDFGRWFDMRPFFGRMDRMRLEQEWKDDTLIVRAELPGIDPDKDVEITVADGRLHVQAERRSETTTDDKKGYRSEFRYGMFERTLRLPPGATEKDIKATYADGILEVSIPIDVTELEAKKIPISKG